MKRKTRAILAAGALLAVIAGPVAAFAAEEPKADRLGWLTIGGDYRFRVDSLKGTVADYYQFNPSDPMNPIKMKEDDVKNDLLYTNRFGLNLKAKVTQDVSLTSRLLMYKTFGNSDDSATSGTFFGDRLGQFDGTQGHTPGDDKLVVDQVYATWNNILEQPVWFSVGRRPSTGGIPSQLKSNGERPGNGGIPSILVDYAFDGMVLGVAPDFEALPGAYAKICYGRGYEAGFSRDDQTDEVHDMDMLGVSVVPYDTDPLYINVQWNRGMDIIDAPVMADSTMGPMGPSVNLGDIDWFGATAFSTLKNIGPGTLNMFASGAMSITHPTDDLSNGMAGMMYNAGQDDDSVTGWSAYVGARYDITSTRTKIGAEFNHGSKNWISMVPASDDLWTGKLGTRGNVYELYVIQELDQKAIASYNAKAFFRVGFQYYDFDYTGSGSWVGEPQKIADLDDPTKAQLFAPLKSAQDIYATFEVKF